MVVMYKNQAREAIAAEARAAIAKANLRYSDVADAMGLNRGVLRRKLNGQSPLGLEELTLLARATGTPVSTLIERMQELAAA